MSRILVQRLTLGLVIFTLVLELASIYMARERWKMIQEIERLQMQSESRQKRSARDHRRPRGSAVHVTPERRKQPAD